MFYTRYGTSLLATLLMAAAAVTASAQPRTDGVASGAKTAASRAHVLSNAEFDALLSHPEKLLLIDVRRPDEISAIGGFPVYLSIQIKDLAGEAKWIPHDRVLVTVSNHAARASKAAELLAGAGFKVAGAIGVQTYEKAGGRIVTIPVPAAGANGTDKAE